MIIVSIVYPADPVGVVPGGIDTFIRGILKYAPADITVKLVGITTDRDQRPVGRWTRCDCDGREIDVFPVVVVDSAGDRRRIPLSLRFTAAVARYREAVDGDILEFHRLEPAILFARDRRGKNVFIHQNMQELKNRKSDILWSRLPGLYYRLEDWLLPKFNSVYVVREDAVAWYQGRYPDIAGNFRFTPTWVDPDVFRMPSDAERARAKSELTTEFGLDADARILLSVGRLDLQKDPLLLAEAFGRVSARDPKARLIYVGDGVLRAPLQEYVALEGLENKVFFAGLRAPRAIARMFWGADMFVLSSAYEGMPMCVLEALGSGVPVVSTDVGEVRRVVESAKNGLVVGDRTAIALAEAMENVLREHDRLAGGPCVEAVELFSPARILEPVYENYRRIAAEGRRHD